MAHPIQSSPPRPAFCAVADWGTTSFRLWLLDANGGSLAESRGPDGLMQVDGRFEATLKAHLRTVDAPAGLPVLICGMAGARQGWVEAPYLETPARLDQLADAAISVGASWADIRILPGTAQKQADVPNVMRGEETQLLGALSGHDDALACMPGTHCKWVRVGAGEVRSFTTFMTGELFEILTRHSILRHAIGEGADGGAVFNAALRAGLKEAQRPLSRLFEVRAAQLLGFSDGQTGADHLSGLLIGSEIAEARALYGTGTALTLIASGTLARRYETGLRLAGFEVRTIDAEDAVRAGLFRAALRLWSGGTNA